MTFDTTIHLSDVITTLVLPMLGYGGLKVYQAITTFVDRSDETADVVDTHTDVLTRAGWTKGMEIPRVGPRHRRASRFLPVLAFLALSTAASAQDVLPTLRELRPLYPTPMSKAQISDLLNKTAQQHPGWMMLRKEAGNICPTPSGKSISCDWLINSTAQWGYDVLRDQEGVAEPGHWGDGPIAPGTELVLPWDTVIVPPVVPPTGPPPQPVPVFDFATAFQRAYDQNERIFADTLKWREDLNGQINSVTDAVNNPGWFKTFFGNRVVQDLLIAAGSWFATHQVMK